MARSLLVLLAAVAAALAVKAPERSVRVNRGQSGDHPLRVVNGRAAKIDGLGEGVHKRGRGDGGSHAPLSIPSDFLNHVADSLNVFSLAVGAFHDRSTNVLHPTIFYFAENLRMEFPCSLKSMVAVLDA